MTAVAGLSAEEAADARRLFPCFDEPAFKVPWQLELIVPAGLLYDVAMPLPPLDQALLHQVPAGIVDDDRVIDTMLSELESR